MMTDRERWNRVMHFEEVDYVPDEEFGYWADTLITWHEQGLPEWVNSNHLADRYFGFSPRALAPVSLGLKPGFKREVLEERGDHQVIVDESGVKCLVNTDGSSSIPKYLSFPIQDWKSWEDFRKRLDPDTDRYAENWSELIEPWKARDYPLGVSVGSLFGWIRNWMGFEGVSMMMHDDPALVEEVMEHITTMVLSTIDKAVKEVDFDFGSMWEDMCFNHGPIISPDDFERLMVPRYERISKRLGKQGVDVIFVDCDGDINQLVPLWLQAGINCMFPIEVAAGSDPIELRDKYGDQVLLLGGVDKIALIRGKEAIDHELSRIEALVAEGGYIPHVDHRVPPDVTFENYLYYLNAKRDRFGIPRPAPYSERAARGDAWAGTLLPQEELLQVKT